MADKMERERRIRRRSVSQHWENIADRLRCGEDKVGTADGACLDVQMRRGYSADRGQGWSSIPYQTTRTQLCRSHGADQQSTKHAEQDTRSDLQCHAVHPETESPEKPPPEVKETNSLVGTCMEKNRRARKTECLLLQLYTSTKRPRAYETKRELYDCIKRQEKNE